MLIIAHGLFGLSVFSSFLVWLFCILPKSFGYFECLPKQRYEKAKVMEMVTNDSTISLRKAAAVDLSPMSILRTFKSNKLFSHKPTDTQQLVAIHIDASFSFCAKLLQMVSSNNFRHQKYMVLI